MMPIMLIIIRYGNNLIKISKLQKTKGNYPIDIYVILKDKRIYEGKIYTKNLIGIKLDRKINENEIVDILDNPSGNDDFG